MSIDKPKALLQFKGQIWFLLFGSKSFRAIVALFRHKALIGELQGHRAGIGKRSRESTASSVNGY